MIITDAMDKPTDMGDFILATPYSHSGLYPCKITGETPKFWRFTPLDKRRGAHRVHKMGNEYVKITEQEAKNLTEPQHLKQGL